MWVFWGGGRTLTHHLTIPLSSLAALHGRGMSQGRSVGSSLERCARSWWAGQNLSGPRGDRGSGPTAPALSEGPELSSARVELGHPLPCQAVARTEPRPCWGWSCPTLWASSFLSPQLLAFYFLLLIPICPKLLQNTSKGSQRIRCAL